MCLYKNSKFPNEWKVGFCVFETIMLKTQDLSSTLNGGEHAKQFLSSLEWYLSSAVWT